MRKRTLAVLAFTLCASCGDRAAPPPPDAAAPAAPREPVACFDLPGAVRTGLMVSPDGKTLFYAERTIAGDVQRYDLVGLDIASKKATVIARDVGTDFGAAGEGKFVFLRPAAEPEPTIGFPSMRPEEPVTRLHVTGAAGGEPVALSPEGVDVRSFAVDAKAGVVFYVGYTRGTVGGELRKVPLAGGESVAIGAATVVFGVVDGGAALIVKVRRGKDLEIQKIPAAGGPPAWAVPAGVNVQVTQDTVLQLGGTTATRQVFSVGMSDGKAAVADGAQDGDLPLGSGAPGFVSRRAGERWTALRFEHGKLAPLFTLDDSALHAAAPLADGTVAALVTHDTDGDGEIASIVIGDHDDESDVCILSPSAAAPLAVPKRSVPKQLAAAVPRLEALLQQPDLAGGKMRFIRSGTLLVVDVPAAGPADPEALRRRLKELQKQVSELSGNPELGLSLHLGKSHRHATSLWSSRLHRFVAKVGVADMVMDDKETSEIEVNGGYGMRETVEMGGPVRKVTIDATCAGKVKNLTKAPLAVEVECALFSPSNFAGSPWTVQRGPTKPASLDPGATGTYEVKLPTITDGAARGSVRAFAAGKELETLDARRYDHVKDWLQTLDRIQQKTGVLPFVRRPTHLATLDYDPHDQPTFEEPDGFGALDKARQDSLARALFAEVSSHFAKQDGSVVPDVVLFGPKGWSYSIDGGKLKKAGE